MESECVMVSLFIDDVCRSHDIVKYEQIKL